MSPRALRFMADFRCIGPDCEDSCCANWQIDVDRQHFVKIARLLARTREGQVELGNAFIDVPEDKKNIGRYMRMQLRENGACPFWGEDQWCTIQKRFGERMLPDVCAHYPRSISIVRDELELSGQLSCPEVARRCLLDANSCDLVEVDEVRFARGAVKQRTYLECGDPYYERFLETRETLLGILSRRDYPMRSRLFFTLAFADRTQPFFHRGTKVWSEEDWDFERRSMGEAAVLDELHGELDKAPIPEGLALLTIARVLQGDVQLRTGGRFRDVVNEVLDSLHREIGASDVSAEEMWNAYVKRRAAKMARSGPRIEEFFEKYCRQYWVRDWYVDSVSLYPHVQALLVRVAVLRFLLLAHPDEDIDKLAVRVFSSMFRGIEHHDSFLKLIGQGLGEDLPTVLHAASLLFV